jgi:hypothetical protein
LSFSKYSKEILNTLHGHPFFFAKLVLTQRERPPMVIFQLDVVHNWPNKMPQKSMDEKSSPSVAEARVFHSYATKWPGRHFGVNGGS